MHLTQGRPRGAKLKGEKGYPSHSEGGRGVQFTASLLEGKTQNSEVLMLETHLPGVLTALSVYVPNSDACDVHMSSCIIREIMSLTIAKLKKSPLTQNREVLKAYQSLNNTQDAFQDLLGKCENGWFYHGPIAYSCLQLFTLCAWTRPPYTSLEA